MASNQAEAEAAVYARLQRAVKQVVGSLDADDLYAVVSQPSDIDALEMALERAKVLSSPVDPVVHDGQRHPC